MKPIKEISLHSTIDGIHVNSVELSECFQASGFMIIMSGRTELPEKQKKNETGREHYQRQEMKPIEGWEHRQEEMQHPKKNRKEKHNDQTHKHHQT